MNVRAVLDGRKIRKAQVTMTSKVSTEPKGTYDEQDRAIADPACMYFSFPLICQHALLGRNDYSLRHLCVRVALAQWP